MLTHLPKSAAPAQWPDKNYSLGTFSFSFAIPVNGSTPGWFHYRDLMTEEGSESEPEVYLNVWVEVGRHLGTACPRHFYSIKAAFSKVVHIKKNKESIGWKSLCNLDNSLFATTVKA